MLRWMDCRKGAVVICFKALFPYLLGGLRKIPPGNSARLVGGGGQNISVITLEISLICDKSVITQNLALFDLLV